MSNLYQNSEGRKTIFETLRYMPFICLNCDEKIDKLRDLARLECYCLRPFYHFHCLAAIPINLCLKCNKRAHILRGIRSIWDSYTHDEWRQSLNLDLLQGINRDYVISLLDSLQLDSPNYSNLNFLVCDFWKTYDLIEDRNLQESKGNEIETNLILNQLEDALRIYPLENKIIIGKFVYLKKIGQILENHEPHPENVKVWCSRTLRKNPQIQTHSDLLNQLWIRTGSIINSNLLQWIKDDPVRNQSIFFSGQLIFDILYERFDKSRQKKDNPILIIQILALEDSILKLLLISLLDKILEGSTYTFINDKFTRKCVLKNLGLNRIKLIIDKISIPIEIHLYKSNDIRKILLNSDAGRIPYKGDGLIVSPSGIWSTYRWLYTCRRRIIETEPLRSPNFSIDTEIIHNGFLLSVDISNIRDKDLFNEKVSDDIENLIIPKDCMRITIDNVHKYATNGVDLNLDTNLDLNLDTNLDSNLDQNLDPNLNPNLNQNFDPNFDPSLNPNFDPDLHNEIRPDLRSLTITNTKCLSYDMRDINRGEIITQLLKKITYNKDSSILDYLPNPYLPRRHS